MKVFKKTSSLTKKNTEVVTGHEMSEIAFSNEQETFNMKIHQCSYSSLSISPALVRNSTVAPTL